MLIDTHAHVNFSAFQDEYREVLARAWQAGVLVVNVGTQLDTSRQAVRMAEEFQIPHAGHSVGRMPGNNNPALYAVVGLHPVHTYSQHVDEEESHFKTREETFDYEAYKQLAQHPLVVGIGECGLDYYRLPAENEAVNIQEIKRRQHDAFVAQIRLARELDKTLVIHCRSSAGTQDAYEDIIEILDEEFGKFQIPNSAPPLRFEIHSFTGSPDIVREFLKRGAYVGLNGIITFDKTGAMAGVVKALPLDRIVLETDSPYLAPVPHRGKKNEPAHVLFVAQKLAEIKGAEVQEVSEQTTRNAQMLFNMPVQQ